MTPPHSDPCQHLGSELEEISSDENHHPFSNLTHLPDVTIIFKLKESLKSCSKCRKAITICWSLPIEKFWWQFISIMHDLRKKGQVLVDYISSLIFIIIVGALGATIILWTEENPLSWRIRYKESSARRYTDCDQLCAYNLFGISISVSIKPVPILFQWSISYKSQ